MVHLEEVRQLVLQDVVLQMAGKEDEVEREIDAALGTATAPATFGGGHSDTTDRETSLRSHTEQSRYEPFLDTLAGKRFQRLRYPSLNVCVCQDFC